MEKYKQIFKNPLIEVYEGKLITITERQELQYIFKNKKWKQKQK